MKAIAILVIGVSLGVGLMLFVPHAPPQIVYADPPSGNGDVNGDEKIDIADAIYLLNYLFNEGPEPEAIECAACDSCCPPLPGGTLPATGQKTCYGYNTEEGLWTELPCDSTDYPGQDGFYQVGCPMAGRFVDNGDGTVTDNCTGLMWQKDTADINGDGTIVWEQDAVTWQTALKYCEGLEFAGHDDWRLPNVRELQSIVDYGRIWPSIDPAFTAKCDTWPTSYYWTSSTPKPFPSSTWVIGFGVGELGNDPKRSPYYLRAVRG